jgi:Flp pilus assembly pilin Flp
VCDILKRFASEESGQDITEYTLLLAFVALSTSALFLDTGGSISGIWNIASSEVSVASLSATS